MTLIERLKKKKKIKQTLTSKKSLNVIYTKSGVRLKASSAEMLESLKRDLALMTKSADN